MEPQKRTGNPLAMVALAVFGWLALAVFMGATLLFDIAARDLVHTWASPLLTSVMWAATHLGEPIFLIPLTLLVAWRLGAAHRWPAARLLAIATLGAWALSEILKLVFHRTRPAAFFGYQEPSSYSFPSGHAMVSICFYGALAMILAVHTSPSRRKLWYAAAAVIVLLVGFSRLYLGVHYLTDVMAGYALGLAILLAIGKRTVTPRTL